MISKQSWSHSQGYSWFSEADTELESKHGCSSQLSWKGSCSFFAFIPDWMLMAWLRWLWQLPLTEVTWTLNVFPQVTLLMEHAVFVVLHDLLAPPLSGITETRKWSASSAAFQEMLMSVDGQLTLTLTFWGAQGAKRENSWVNKPQLQKYLNRCLAVLNGLCRCHLY